MNPYRTSQRPQQEPETKPEPPRELDMVRIIESQVTRFVGCIGYISMISDKVFMVSFIKNRRPICGFFFENELEIVRRHIEK